MIPSGTEWYEIVFARGVVGIAAQRVLVHILDDFVIPRLRDVTASVIENARTRWKRRQSSGITAEELTRAIREDESIDTDSEMSEEEQLAELRDTLQKAKRDLRSPSIDPDALRW